MRLIDADEFKRQIAGMAIVNNYSADKANKMCDLIDNQKTAYDENNVLEQLHNAGGCDGSTEYARGWDDAMEEAERIVAAGLSPKANAGWNEPD